MRTIDVSKYLKKEFVSRLQRQREMHEHWEEQSLKYRRK